MAELIRLASQPILVPFDSSPALEQTIERHKNNAWTGHLVADSSLNGRSLPTHPVELLLWVGQATAFLPPPFDALSHLWPVARYLQSMEVTPVGRLRLEPSIHPRVVRHQLGVLSEAMGTAAGCLLASRHLNPTGTLEVDDLESRPLGYRWRPSGSSRRIPDLWLRPRTTPGSVIETKGAATRAPVASIASGASQLDGSLRRGARSLNVDRWICASHGIKTGRGLQASALHVPARPQLARSTSAPTDDRRFSIDERGLAGFLPSATTWMRESRTTWEPDIEGIAEQEWDRRQIGPHPCLGRYFALDRNLRMFVGVVERSFDWLTRGGGGPAPQVPMGYVEELDQLDRLQSARLADVGPWRTSVAEARGDVASAVSVQGQAVALIRAG